MGNARSVFLCRDADVDWNVYIAETWRSERVRDLDQLGGLERPAIRRGNSMTAKLDYLQTAVQRQGDSMQDALSLGGGSRKKANEKKREPLLGKFDLRTEQRARERGPLEFDDLEQQQQQQSPTWGCPTFEQQERDKLSKHAARSRMFEYARHAQAAASSKALGSSSGLLSSSSNALKHGSEAGGEFQLEVSDYLSAVEHSSDGCRHLSTRSSIASTSDRASVASSHRPLLYNPSQGGRENPVAIWRLRIHRARRRAILVVLTVVRLRRGFNHPKRMQRLDSFGFCIPLALSDEYGRFVEEQLRHSAIETELQGCKDAIDEVLNALLHQGIQSASGLPLSPGNRGARASSSGALSSARLSRQPSRRTQSAAVAGPASQRSTASSPGNLINGSGSGMRSLSASASASSAGAGGEAAPSPSGPSLMGPMASGPSLTTLVEDAAQEVPAGGGLGNGAVGGGGDGRNMLRMAVAGRRSVRVPEGSNILSTVAELIAAQDDAVASPAPTPVPSTAPRRAVRISESGEVFGSGPGYGSGSRSIGASSAVRAGRASESGASPSPSPSSGRRRTQQPPASETQSDADRADDDLDVVDPASSFTFRLSVGSSASGVADEQRDIAKDPLFTKREHSNASSMASADGSVKLSRSISAAVLTGRDSARSNASSANGSGGGVERPPHHNHHQPHGGGGGGGGGSNARQPGRPSASMVVRAPRASDPSSCPLPGVLRSYGGPPLAPLSEGIEGGVKELRRSTENAKMAMLSKRLEQETENLTKCELMLGMYVNRANAAWAERQRGWRPGHPSLLGAGDVAAFEGSEELRVQRADVVRRLRHGQLVFQIFAAEDELAPGGAGGNGVASSGPVDLWTSDPWALITASSASAASRPGTAPLGGERLEGLPLGGRALTQLRMAVEAAAGPEAAAALTVLLHLHEGQRDAAVRDLVARRFYGLRKENVFVTVQQRHPGYRYGISEGMFVPVPAEEVPELKSLGAGYAMMQMCWVADAYTLTELPEAPLLALQGSLLEVLQKRGVEWLISRRSSDLSLYSSESAVNLKMLALALQLREKNRVTMVTEVVRVSHMSSMRQLDSMFMNLQPTTTGTSSSLGPIKANKTPQGVVELRSCELASTAMVEAVSHVRAESPANELLVGVHRYAFHLPSLAAMLADSNVFRPKLSLAGATVRIGLELSDLTSAPKARCVAVPAAGLAGQGQGQGPEPALACCLLQSAAELEELVPLVQLQDLDPDLWKAVARCRTASSRQPDGGLPSSRGYQGKPMSPPSPPRPDGAGAVSQRIVVFCADNEATQTAVEFVSMFARPGRDEVYLMTVVPSDMHQEAGNQLVSRFFRTLARSMIHPRVDVISKGYSGLIDCLESYAAATDASLVVMGSQVITSQPAMSGSASVVLSCMKRLQLPIVMVTVNTRLLQGEASPGGARLKSRVLALVDAHSRGLVNYLFTNGILDPMRGDKLHLGQVFPYGRASLSPQQQLASKRLMDNFADVSAGHHLQPIRSMLDGPLDKALHSYADSELLHVVALQLKPGEKSLPGEVLSLMRCCKAAILMYREKPGSVL